MIFSAPVTHDYLVLLGIRQTCRLQGKSFFKFLTSPISEFGLCSCGFFGHPL
jgi:hypothetical protein